MAYVHLYLTRNKGRTSRYGLCTLMQQVGYRSCGSSTDH